MSTLPATWTPVDATSGEVQICNMALAHIGMPPLVSSIKPPDGSNESRQCAFFYPIALKAILQQHPWNHLTRTEPLTLLSDRGEAEPLRYRYAQPPRTVMVWDVLISKESIEQASTRTPSNYTDSARLWMRSRSEELRKWKRWSATVAEENQQPVIDTTIPSAWINYTHYDIAPANFRPLMAEALSYLLAGYLAHPLRNEPSLSQVMKNEYTTVLDSAKALDSREGEQGDEQKPPSWIEARWYYDAEGPGFWPGSSNT